MDVFVTGGTGYVGRAVVRGLRAAGHRVRGLARSEGSAEALRELGAGAVRGALGDPSAYAGAAADHEALVHMAFDPTAPVELDEIAVRTLLGAAADGTKPGVVVYTSGCWVLGDTGDEPADETAPLDPADVVAWRPAHEERILSAAGASLATAVVRPGMVYGGSGGLVSGFFETAAGDGAAVHVGDGGNRWSFVHRDDLARLYVRVVEAEARGVYHGVDETPVRVADAARAASEAAGAGGEVRSRPLEEAREEMGAMADALVLDQALAGRRSRELGWRPGRPSFPEAADEAYGEWKEGTG